MKPDLETNFLSEQITNYKKRLDARTRTSRNKYTSAAKDCPRERFVDPAISLARFPLLTMSA